MTVELVTGAARSAHVSSDDVANLFAGLAGRDAYVMGNSLPKLTFQGANRLQIPACGLLVNGRFVRLTGSTQVSIQSGSQSAKRRDLICVRYIADHSSNTETAELKVVAGNSVSKSQNLSDPNVPLKGNILDGAPDVYVPIIKVELDGLTPSAEWIIGNIASPQPARLFSGTYESTKSAQITLSDIVTNYTRLDVVYQTSGGDVGTTTLYNPRGGMKFSIVAMEPSNNMVFIKNKCFEIQSNSKTINAARPNDSTSAWWAKEHRFQPTDNAGIYTSHANVIGIIAVYGYKI
ncbi:hypothetical protein [Atopobium fossor]|uniref:hypothetical protein n=1 Tax=Atopobium fossor TaxID=39487 RepID=UPI0004204EBD|nr:hypothetical protein [Atopobium fossor]